MQQNKKSCQDRVVFSLDDPVLKLWQIFVVIVSFISSIMYTFYAAFGGPELSWFNKERIAVMSLEIVFLMDLVLQFFIEYIPDDKYKTERNLKKIALRYL